MSARDRARRRDAARLRDRLAADGYGATDPTVAAWGSGSTLTIATGSTYAPGREDLRDAYRSDRRGGAR